MKESHGLSAQDEYTHSNDSRPDWRESYYFNWVDLRTNVSGFSTIGLLPNAGKREFVFALFYDEAQELYYNEPTGPLSKNLSESLADGVLSFQLVAPLKEWRIVYNGKNVSVDIVWPSRFPVYDFGKGSGTSWTGHFEQSGSPHGVVKFKDGRKIDISGLGERDKSWGVRNWHIDGWFALHAQFEEISIGLRRDVVGGEVHSSGSISSQKIHVPVHKVNIIKETRTESGVPIGCTIEVIGNNDEVYTLTSRLVSTKSYVRFAREFVGGTTELYECMAIHECKEIDSTGTGLIEWLYTHQK